MLVGGELSKKVIIRLWFCGKRSRFVMQFVFHLSDDKGVSVYYSIEKFVDSIDIHNCIGLL